MTVKYTDAMISELRQIGKLDYNSANAFATKHGIGVRSVIAKARALEVPYQAKDPKQRGAGAKDKAPAKEIIVRNIESTLRVSLPSLSKMTVLDLLALEVAVGG